MLAPAEFVLKGTRLGHERPNGARCFRNRDYVVITTDLDGGELGVIRHLSIRRDDRKAIHDWRHFQQIKNELCGREMEGVELYPAESRLVDEANQYHLYVIMDPRIRWPVGQRERVVGTPSEAAVIGATQRPWEDGLTTGQQPAAPTGEGTP
jgi:hypothetical protein